MHSQSPDEFKNTVLIEATIANDAGLLTKLLVNGADPNFVEDYAGVTALHHAADRGCYEAALVLLTAGAEIKEENLFGITPVQVAKNQQHHRLVELFNKFLRTYSATVQ